MKIECSELFLLLSCTVRYALGRKSYIVGWVADTVKAYAHFLNVHEIATIKADIEHAIRQADNTGTNVGMPMDHQEWEQLDKFLAELLEKGDFNEPRTI